MRETRKIVASVLLLACLALMAVPVSAADELLGTVVDGSLLTEETEAVGYAYPKLRGKYFAYGSGSVSIDGVRQVGLGGTTAAYQNVDQLYVLIYLQRLVDGNWDPVLTMGPKYRYNASYVSNSGSYSVSGGYYYRAYGHHTVKHNGTSEFVPSYSDGIWVS